MEDTQTPEVDPQFKKDTYLNLKDAFGDDYPLTEDEFNSRFDSDENFVNDTYKNLKDAYGDDYTLTEADFKKKVGTISPTTPELAPGSEKTPPTSGSEGSPNRSRPYEFKLPENTKKKAVEDVLKARGYDQDKIDEFLSPQPKPVEKGIPKLAQPDTFTTQRDQTAAAPFVPELQKGYTPEELLNQDKAFKEAYDVVKNDAVKPREEKQMLTTDEQDNQELDFDKVEEIVQKKGDEYKLSPNEKTNLLNAIIQTYKSEPALRKARIAADMEYKSKFGVTPWQQSEILQKEVDAKVQKKLDQVKQSAETEIVAKKQVAEQEATVNMEAFSSATEQVYKKYNDLVQSGQMKPEEAQAAMTKDHGLLIKDLQDKTKKIQSRYMQEQAAANIKAQQTYDDWIKTTHLHSGMTPEQQAEYSKMFSKQFASAEKQRNLDMENTFRQKGLLQKVNETLTAGSGDLLVSAGGMLGMAGFANANYAINKAVEKQAFKDNQVAITPESATDLDWWIANGARTLPMMAVLAPIGMGAGAGSSAIARVLTSSARFEGLIASVGGGLASWKAETLMEQGSGFNQAIAEGKTPEQAAQVAKDIGEIDMATIPLQMMEIAPFFNKMPAILSVAMGTISGGTEELIQGYATNKALANVNGLQYTYRDYLKDPEAGPTFVLGAAMSAPFVIGGKLAEIKHENKVKAQLGIIQNLITQGSHAKASGVIEAAFNNDLIDQQTKDDLDGLLLKSIEAAKQTASVPDAVLRASADQALVEAMNYKEQADATPEGPMKDALSALFEAKNTEAQTIISGVEPIYQVKRKGDEAPTVMSEDMMNEFLSDPKMIEAIASGDYDVTIRNNPKMEKQVAEAVSKHKEEVAKLAEEKKQAQPQEITPTAEALKSGDKIQWNVFGNEESGEWTVGEKTKTRGGQDAVALTKEYVESAIDGETYTKEYADKNGIKYTNEPSIVTHIVPLSDLTPTPEGTKEGGYEVIASDYLLNGGAGSILSLDYLIQGLSGTFEKASGLINNIRKKYSGKLGDIKDLVGTELYDTIVSEIKDALSKSYNNEEAQSILDEILKYPTGLPSKLGNEISSKIDQLNSQSNPQQNEQEVNNQGRQKGLLTQNPDKTGKIKVAMVKPLKVLRQELEEMKGFKKNGSKDPGLDSQISEWEKEIALQEKLGLNENQGREVEHLELEDPGAGTKPVSEETPVVDKETKTQLEKNGYQVENTLDAERAIENGERVFAYAEQDGEPSEITDPAKLQNYSADQLLILPKEKAEPEKTIVAHEGKTEKVKFKSGATENEDVYTDATYSLIESEDLHPSHDAAGARNPNHTIALAQPKERNDQGSRLAQDNILRDPKIAELGVSPNAYSGAQVVNERGEVIQGNNRSIGLKKHYDKGGVLYKERLAETADQYGLTPEQVMSMKNPVLVRVAKVDDNMAVELGQFDAKDLESGGKQRIDPLTASRKLSMKDKSKIASALFDEKFNTLNAAIRANASLLSSVFKGILNPAQFNSAFDKEGNLTSNGVNDIQATVMHLLFDGGSATLPEIFDGISDSTKKALEKSLKYIFSVDDKNSLLPEVQNAILAYGDFLNSGGEDFNGWSRAIDMFLQKSPSEIFTPTELKIAELFHNAKNQSDVSKIFAQYAELVNGKDATLLEDEKPGITKEEAVSRIFNIPNEKQNPTPQDQSGDQKTGPEKTEREPTEKEKQINKELDDLAAEMRKLMGLNIGVNPEALAVAIKFVAKHVELGIYKLADIVTNAKKFFGDKLSDFIDSIKAAYMAYMPQAEDDVIDKMDDIKTVKNYQYVPNRSGDSAGHSENPTTNQPGDGKTVSGGRRRDSGNVGGKTNEFGEPENGKSKGSESGNDLFSPPVGETGNKKIPGEGAGTRDAGSDSGGVDGRGNSTIGTKGHDGSKSAGSNDVDPGTKKAAGSFAERQKINEKKQVEAEGIKNIIGDIDNIRETLPYLLPEQQDDVLKAEQRFFGDEHKTDERANGKGMLFTNGTGTGKTFTGLGIIKRFVKEGKGNVLIIVPSQPKVSDWANDGKKLGLNITPLQDTSTGGTGAVITTYANFRANEELLKRNFDLVVYDESHRLMESKGGDASSTTNTHYKISNKDKSWAFRRLTETNPLWKSQKELLDKLTFAKKTGAPFSEIEKIEKKIEEVQAKIKEATPEIERQAEKAVDKTKVLFLSATPFKAHFNLRYANGFLFNWGDQTVVNDRGSRVDAESRFYLDHFGSAYEWKYPRLQSKSDQNADAIAMQEVNFAENLKKQGSMSGRVIESDRDYSREFPKVSGFNTELFNKAFSDIFSYQDMDQPFKHLRDAARQVFFSYNYTTQLFESLKTSMSIDRIQKHLDMGRKAVVFHRRQQANSTPPYRSIIDRTIMKAEEVIDNEFATREEKEIARTAIAQAENFEVKYKDLLDYESNLDYRSAVDQISEAFPGRVGYINGNISTKEKNKAIADFNRDGSGIDVIVIQEEAGKEGISLHDTTGKHQRVLISLSMPISTTTALQVEGRIYRIGQESDAIFEYPLLGLDMETAYFGQNLNKRLSTTENLAVGNGSRDLIRSYSEGVLFNSSTEDPHSEQGKGGKEYDQREQSSQSDFQKAKLVYATNQKTRGKRDQRAGVDYFATPEPVGQKMVEWANLASGESMLEPSAGHGAIAMWTPNDISLTAVEPSFELFSKLGARSGGGTKRILNQNFEDLHVHNKYDGVVMNPPFGSNSKTAVDHVEKAFKHLDEGGRIVAILPDGGSMQKRLDSFLYGTDEKGKQNNPTAILRAEIKLPSVTFSQAGTAVNTKVVIIDKISSVNQNKIGSVEKIDLSDSKTINQLFDNIENLDVPERIVTNSQPSLVQNNPIGEQGDVSQNENAKPIVSQNDIIHPIREYVHTKTKELLYKAEIINRTTGDVFQSLKSNAKKLGGTYSPFAKGFLFNDKNNAEQFRNNSNGSPEPTPVSKNQALQGEFDSAKNDLKDAWDQFKNTNKGNLGVVSFDPEKEAQALYDLHEKMVNLATAAIRLGVSSIEDWAKKVGVQVTRKMQLAWDDAQDRIAGYPPIVADKDYFKNDDEFQKVLDKQNKDYEDKQKSFYEKLKLMFTRGMLDTRWNLRQFLENNHSPEVFAYKNLVAGASQAAEHFFNEKIGKIYKGLNSKTEVILDGIIQARRNIALDDFYDEKRDTEKNNLIADYVAKNGANPTGADLKAIEDIAQENNRRALHSGDTNREEAAIHLAKIEASDPKLYEKLMDRADQFFDAMRELLKFRLDEGRIDKATYDNMVRMDYAKRIFLERLFDGLTSPNKSYSSLNPAGIEDIHKMDGGSVQMQFNRSRFLLMNSASTAYRAVFENNANRELYNFAKSLPTNGIVQTQDPIGPGKFPPAPHGWTQIKYYEKGEIKSMVMQNEMAQEWMQMDPNIKSAAANVIRTALSGYLREFATGVFNPVFFLTNFPRDIVFVTLFTNTYSPFIPIAAAKMTKDMLASAWDVFTRGKLVKNSEFLKATQEGMMMNFLTHQGSAVLTGKFTQNKLERAWDTVHEFMGYISLSLEMLPRMAIRTREIKKATRAAEKKLGRPLDPITDKELIKRISRLASNAGRDYLDFAQGGSVNKTIDIGVPYFNAANLAFRNAVKYSVNNKGASAVKIAQYMAFTAALAAYLLSKYKDDYDDGISTDEKARYHIILLPFTKEDPVTGKITRAYLKVSKEQQAAPAAAISEELVNYGMNGKFDMDKIWTAMDYATPNLSSAPMVAAWSAVYANYDTYTKQKIWKGEEWAENWSKYDPNDTQQLFVQVGKVWDKSPAQVKRGASKLFTDVDKNFFTSGFLSLWDKTTEFMNPDEKRDLNDAATNGFEKALGAPLKKILDYTKPGINDKTIERAMDVVKHQGTQRIIESNKRKQLVKDIMEKKDVGALAFTNKEKAKYRKIIQRENIGFEGSIVLRMGVENMERAKYLVWRTGEMKTEQEKVDYLNLMKENKVISKTVVAQMRWIWIQQGIMKSNLKQGGDNESSNMPVIR